ncbi:MAG: hypothetical protein IJ594_00190 [Oscillospiraceae bacterium]|nr:hypothetical protein [Oscillospiraceae bacterium]
MIDRAFIETLYRELPAESREFLDKAVAAVTEAKKKGGKVVVATGSGPNIHEGVTTLIAELMDKGVIDGVTTSSAVVSHEMGGVLDRVKRIDADLIGPEFLDMDKMPRGNIFELTELTDEDWAALRREMLVDEALVEKCRACEGKVIIKAAGNMAYPMGLRTETIAGEIGDIARSKGLPFEFVAGQGCDKRTMLGAGARKGLPVLVSIPQLIGGGHVGISLADSISIAERCSRIADMMGSADVIIESAVALTQEIHDGPFETYTGHGIWAHWNGYKTYSLKDRTLIRFDLDENLKKAWDLDKHSGDVQKAIDDGLPKTKLTKIPFRMEMSAFSRMETSLPVIGDIGVLWPIFALHVCSELGIELDFVSYPQQSEQGKAMRDALVREIRPLDMNAVRQWARR